MTDQTATQAAATAPAMDPKHMHLLQSIKNLHQASLMTPLTKADHDVALRSAQMLENFVNEEFKEDEPADEPAVEETPEAPTAVGPEA